MKKQMLTAATMLAVANAAVATSDETNLKQPFYFNELAETCAPHVDKSTLQAIVRTESSFNPYAIGVVRGHVKQPTTLKEAVATAKALHEEGKNFSMGLAQINRYNLEKYGLDYESVFDMCKNVKTGADILAECYGRAPGRTGQVALQEALSCYYSGNFRTGFGQDLKGLPSYVERIMRSAKKNTDTQEIKLLAQNEPSSSTSQPTVPAINPDAPVAKVTVRKTSSNKGASTTKPTQKSKPIDESSRATKAQASWDAFNEW